ncbi:hypothetical protein [Ekhidna sp.]|uniref:hypothetical protein n=1 Tax=Ekhidna sp. TaxID=2608089 RepID=UPI0032EC8F46
MRTSFLEYSKIILTKVSFDNSLFKKEFRKALRMLKPHERHELKSWAKTYIVSNEVKF